MKIRKRVKTSHIIAFSEIFFIGLTITTTFFYYFYSKNALVNAELNRIENNSAQFSKKINNDFTRCIETSLRIFNRKETRLLSSHHYDYLEDYYGKSNALNNLITVLDDVCSNSELIETAAIKFPEYKNYKSEIVYPESYNFLDKKNIEYLFKTLSTDEYNYSLGFYNDKLFFLASSGAELKTSMIIAFNSDYFFDEFNRVLGGEYQMNFDLIEDKIVLSCFDNVPNPENYLNSGIFEEANKLVSNNLYVSISVNESFYVLYVQDIHRNTNINAIPLSPIVVSIIILIIFAALGVFLMYYFTIRPILYLKNKMISIGGGNLDTRIDKKISTDFQILFDNFNLMAESLSSYVNDNYIKQLSLKEAEFKLLQSQINPHFLYNCFSTLNFLCKSSDNKLAVKFSKALSSYYYYIQKNKGMFASLENELDFLNKYIEIQQMRFNDRVEIIREGELKEHKDLMVPKLIFQPIVENSYKYCFSETEYSGKLFIKIEEITNYVRIMIYDNGVISNEQFDEICKKIKPSNEEVSAIYNVYSRLRGTSEGNNALILGLSENNNLLNVFYFKIGEKKC